MCPTTTAVKTAVKLRGYEMDRPLLGSPELGLGLWNIRGLIFYDCYVRENFSWDTLERQTTSRGRKRETEREREREREREIEREKERDREWGREREWESKRESQKEREYGKSEKKPTTSIVHLENDMLCSTTVISHPAEWAAGLWAWLAPWRPRGKAPSLASLRSRAELLRLYELVTTFVLSPCCISDVTNTC